MKQRLWGNNYFNARQKKWQTSNHNDLKRAFVQFIFEPLEQAFVACKEKNESKLTMMEKAMGIKLDPELKKSLEGRQLFDELMQLWVKSDVLDKILK